MLQQSLYGLSERIAGLQQSVAEKKTEVERLKRVEKEHSVVGAQVQRSCALLLIKKCRPWFSYLGMEQILFGYVIIICFSEYRVSYTHVVDKK